METGIDICTLLDRILKDFYGNASEAVKRYLQTVSYYLDFAYIRGENKDSELGARVKFAKNKIKVHVAELKNELAKCDNQNNRLNLKHLLFYARLTVYLADVFDAKQKGNLQLLNKKYDKFLYFLNKNELKNQSVFDCYVFEDVVRGLLKIS